MHLHGVRLREAEEKEEEKDEETVIGGPRHARIEPFSTSATALTRELCKRATVRGNV